MLEDFRVKQGGKDGECTSNFTVRVLPSCFLETTIVIQERHPKMQVRGDPLNTPAVSKVEIRAECGAASEQWNPRSLRSRTAHLKDMVHDPASEKLQRIRQRNSGYEALPKNGAPKNNAQRWRRRMKKKE